MVFRILSLLFCICTAGSSLLEAQGPPEPATFEEISPIKVNVNLVTTNVTVLGSAPRMLQDEDFIISDNGVVQKITNFSQDMIPLSVALVVDRSDSIRDYLPLLKEAALSALSRLKPEDQVALFTFDAELLKLSDLTVDHNLISRIVGKLTVGGGTDVYGALYHTAAYLKMKTPRNRRAIILISDNCHTSPGSIDEHDAYKHMLESGTTLYSIFAPGKNLKYYGNSEAIVSQLAEESGGESLNARTSMSLQKALENAISNLRHQYTLGFIPSDSDEDGRFHRLTVKLSSEGSYPGCQLLYRKGYYSGAYAGLRPLRKKRPVSEVVHAEDHLYELRHCIFAAASIDLDLPDIPIIIRASEHRDSGGKPQTNLDLHIDLSNVGFQIEGDRYRCKLYIAIFSTNKLRGILREYWRVAEGMLGKETYNQVLKNGMSISIVIPRMPREEMLKIVVFDEGTETLGSRILNLP